MKTLAFLLLAAVSLDSSQVAPDVAQRMARFQKVEMPFTYAGMSAREKRVVDEMIAACRDLENIFWRQNDPENVALYNSLAGATDPKLQAARHYLGINGSRYALLNHNEPFIGSEPMPPGRSLLPKGVSRDEIEAYVKAHPAEKKAVYAERTVVELVSRNPLKLKTTPYHVKYRRWLDSAAKHLRSASALSHDKAFAGFLDMRAKALLTDDYYPSDLAWVGMQDPK